MSFLTAGGRLIEHHSMKPDDIDINDIAEHLAKQPRFLGATPGVLYNVAQHSIMVAAIVRHVGGTREAQLQGLLHDAPEAYLCDLPTDVKRLHDLRGYRALEYDIWLVVSKKFGVNPQLNPLVKAADTLALAVEVRDLMPEESAARFTHGLALADIAHIPVIKPLAWEHAMRHFLDEFAALRGGEVG